MEKERMEEEVIEEENLNENSEEDKKDNLENNESDENKNSDEVLDEISEEEKIKKELEESRDKYLRLKAEFQNYKKRVEKEKQRLIKYAHGEVIKDVLPIIDNFERAINSSKNDENTKSLLEGIELIKKSFDDFLDNNKVKVIETVGEKFNTEFHHAVMKEDTEEYDHNEIIQELQKGYILEDKVIRHAMVKVASNK